VILEGVTQYIPKPSTADTLNKLKTLVAPGSILLISYVDRTVFEDDPSKCGPPKLIQRILKISQSTGEAWISGWYPEEFQSFLKDLGYQVLSDTTTKDYNEKYLIPLGRGMQEDEIPCIERFVVAKVEP
jgi:O-methyltransferase involved in polyketide biosynthesis